MLLGSTRVCDDGTAEAMRAILRANFHDPAWAEDDAYIKRRVEASLAPGAWEAVAAARLKPPTMPPRSDFGQPDTIEYERIRYPTLVIAGAEDKLRLPGYHKALGPIPDSRIVVLAEAGTWSTSRRPANSTASSASS